MLSGEKILVTGPAGQIAYPLTARLAQDNEVWGLARFSDATSRERVDALGVTTVACDVASGDFTGVPSDFTYVLHLAAIQPPGPAYDEAIRVNAEGTGLLLAHCRRATAALVMSSHSVYRPNPDASHAYAETDPLGDASPPHSPPYSVSKLAQEAVARYCARAYDLPVVLARMNSAYGPNGGLPMLHLDAILEGRDVVTRHDPCTYSPIHEDDIAAQVPALLDAAAVPAFLVNWCGDEAVSVQDWCGMFGDLTGIAPNVVVREMPGTQPSAIADPTRRASVTGPCRATWRDGMTTAAKTRMAARA